MRVGAGVFVGIGVTIEAEVSVGANVFVRVSVSSWHPAKAINIITMTQQDFLALIVVIPHPLFFMSIMPPLWTRELFLYLFLDLIDR